MKRTMHISVSVNTRTGSEYELELERWSDGSWRMINSCDGEVGYDNYYYSYEYGDGDTALSAFRAEAENLMALAY